MTFRRSRRRVSIIRALAMRSCFVIALLGLGGGYAAGLRPALAQTVKSASPLVAVKLLKVEPVKGHVGDSFTITGEGLPAGKTVEFFGARWTRNI